MKNGFKKRLSALCAVMMIMTSYPTTLVADEEVIPPEVRAEVPAEGAADLPEEGRAEDPAQPQAETPAENVVKIQLETSSGTPEGEAQAEPQNPLKEIQPGQSLDGSLDAGGEYRARLRVTSADTLALATSGNLSVRLKVVNETTNAAKTFAPESGTKEIHASWQAAPGTYLLVFTAVNPAEGGSFRFSVKKEETADKQTEEKEEEKEEEPSASAETANESGDDTVPELPAGNQDEQPAADAGSTEIPETTDTPETPDTLETPDETVRQDDAGKDEGTPGNTTNEETEPESNQETTGKQNTENETPEAQTGADRPEKQDEPENQVQPEGKSAEEGQGQEQEQTNEEKTAAGEEETVKGEQSPEERAETNEPDETWDQTDEEPKEEPGQKTEAENRQEAGENQQPEEIFLGTQDVVVSYDVDVSAAAQLIPAPGTAKSPAKSRKLMAVRSAAPARSKTEYVGLDIAPAGQISAAGNALYHVDVALPDPIDMLAGEEDVQVSGSSVALYHIVDGTPVQVNAEFTKSGDGRSITGFSFVTDGFSPYIVAYTVEFRYEDKVFELNVPGAKDILLSDILRELEILGEGNEADFMAQVAEVSVSDPDAFSLAYSEGDWSFRVLRETENPESLTVQTQNGRKYIVTLAATGITEVETEDGKATIHTVNGWYLPEGTDAYAEALTSEQGEAAVQAVKAANEALNDETGFQVFSVGLEDVDTDTYEGFNIDLRLQETVAGKDFRLYQVKDGKAEDITATLRLEGEEYESGRRDLTKYSFTTDSFAEYVLCYSLVTYYTAFDGTTFRIALNYGPEAEIPENAELDVQEILPEEDAYGRYLAQSAEKLGVGEEAVTFARFFDIKIKKDDREYEPNAPVQVTISYADPIPMSEEVNLSVVHFGKEDTEIIRDIELHDEYKEISYQQGSFSVTGTILTTPPAETDQGQPYAVIVKLSNNKYYSIRNDGALDEVNYSVDDNTAKVMLDYPLLWTYIRKEVSASVTGGSNQTVNLLRLEAEAAGIGYYAQPDDYYYRYIDPSATEGKTEEEKIEPFPNSGWTIPAVKEQHERYYWQCALQYSDHRIKSIHSDYYLGVNEKDFHIVGQATEEQAAEVYLAKVETIQPPDNLNHTVNHIDISIEGGAFLNVPLAYGKYKYTDKEGQEQELEVNAENEVTLHLKIDSVEIEAEDMKSAQVTAFSNRTKEMMDDAFYITGYSRNNSTEASTVQIRLEGSFKVSDLPPYTDPEKFDDALDIPEGISWPDQQVKKEFQIKEQYLNERKNSRVFYTITINKELVFDWIYTDSLGNTYQLYDSEGGKLSTTTMLNLSKTFDYWDEYNECPPLDEYAGEISKSEWQKGHILWNSGLKYGSGMDFTLQTRAEEDIPKEDRTIVAIEITKYLKTDDDEVLQPEQPVTNSFIVYQKVPSVQTDWDSVLGVGVDKPVDRVNIPEGYTAVHSKNIIVGNSGEGLVYDYDVKKGMTYVREDAELIPKQITDLNGEVWSYVGTETETEYVWRAEGDADKRHQAKGNICIPEVLGEYNTDLFNRFLEFYVTNVYKQPKEEVSPYHGTGDLGTVGVGEEITYKINYYNYSNTVADIVIKDTLDPNVEFVRADKGGKLENKTVVWTLSNVPAGESGSVTMTVKVLKSALISEGGPGNVVNDGNTASIKIGNDNEYTLNTIKNPVEEEPHKKETAPYVGTGTLGGVKVGDTITYEISYKNYEAKAANIVINDQLDEHVDYVSSSVPGTYNSDGRKVTWNLANVDAGTSGTVTLTVKVKESTLTPGEVINKDATVRVGNDRTFTLETVKNPVPEPPHKKETAPYVGTGTLGGVKIGDTITYEISYKNYKAEAANVTIKDQLDANVQFVSATDSGTESSGVVTWNLANVDAGKSGTVTLTVKVLEGALASKSGPGKVVNGGETATVQVENDHAFTLETVENPVPEEPHKKETAPYVGTGTLGGVKVGETITYEISYKNYKADAANIVINDQLDEHVDYVSSSAPGTYTAKGRKVTWNLTDVAGGTKDTVTLTVKVLEGALASKSGPGKVVNGGETATVQVGNDHAFTLETVENPVEEEPHKKETAPYVGTGTLGGVKVGETITYDIGYTNYKAATATLTIQDTLDANVLFVNASNPGTYTADGHKVTWNLTDVAGGTKGTVTLTVKVLESALMPGEVINKDATVRVGNDRTFTLETVKNPVPEEPHKKETAPYVGTGTLGGVKVGETITYEISYKNYKDVPAKVTITDTLDEHVEFVGANPTATRENKVVTWNLADVPAGGSGTVTLKVKALESAKASKDGPGVVINTGATVRVGNDHTFTLETVENPVPEEPIKKETAPYVGTGTLDGVKVGDVITYEIGYQNYKKQKADITIRDTLDEHVKFISADNGGVNTNGIVTWTVRNAEPGSKGTVTLRVEVLPGAQAPAGPGKVVNGGESAGVKVGNDHEFTLNEVENPVPEPPHKQESAPYEGTGVLGVVKVGDTITYDISYKNYKTEAANIVIDDTLDAHVQFVSASEPGTCTADGRKVTWHLANVAAGTNGTVTLKVKVRKSAEIPNGPGMVVNGGDTATVKIGNDHEYTLEKVTNPVVPNKQETAPYEGLGELGAVKVGETITYQINYVNFTGTRTTVVIKDKLDQNVEYVSSEPTGSHEHSGGTSGGTVTFTINDVAAGAKGSVTLTVKVLEGALASKEGLGKVANGPASVIKVGDQPEINLNTVENPVPEPPEKKEITPYQGTGTLGGVKAGEEITYRIQFRNYKNVEADINIADQLDKHVEFVSASDQGWNDNGTIRWTLKNYAANTDGSVALTVKVLESALESRQGPGKVVNGGDTATLQVGDDHEFTLNTVENPVTDPHKKENAPYVGTGTLGGVKVGEEITYELSYKNYKEEKANITITDNLDQNVSYVSASTPGQYNADGRKVTWNLTNVDAGTSGTVTLTVKVLESALTLGEVINKDATVRVGNDRTFTLETVKNPVPEPPHKKETAPYVGTGTLGGVKVGDTITYEISYKNYKAEAANIVINDPLDEHVDYVSSSAPGTYTANGRKVTWNLTDVAGGTKGTVTLTVKVLEGALASKSGPGKVVNGGETATVQVGNDHAFTLETVENPVEEEPHKKETAPYVGTGMLGGVKVGETITYDIVYTNYKAATATLTIQDTLDANVLFVNASNPGTYTTDGHKVTWNLTDVAGGTKGTVTLTVKVLESALTPGEVINKDATVRVGNDRTFTLETVKNPVPVPPHKKETAPYVGTGTLGGVKVGETITYEISYKNYKADAANIVINDQLDEHVDYVSSSAPGTYTAKGRKVTWNLTDVAGGTKGTVTLTVKVLEGALASKSGPGKVVNGGETATVQVGNDHAFTLETVENPVEEEPHKQETGVTRDGQNLTGNYAGTGTLGGVKVGDEITYGISYTNYKAATATLTIRDTLDSNVEYVASDPEGSHSNGVVTWNLTNVGAGQKGTVTLTVKVLEGATESGKGPGKVANEGATVRVGDDHEFILETVENPVADPHKKETAPYEGNGVLGGVKAGDEITYEISYKNYKAEAATVTIQDKLDANVQFVSAAKPGHYNRNDHKVTWTLANVDAGTSGTVTLTVKVLEGALASRSGPGKVVNGGETATVQVGDDPAVTLETVENPLPEPHKKETEPYDGTGVLGGVKVGGEITYEISYRNYKDEAATVTIRDELDPNVQFVSASDKGAEANGVVTWTLADVPAGKEGTVELTVKVLEDALTPGKVVNSGATVKVGNDHEFTLETVENPVTEPHKRETKPYEGNGVLGGVKVGDEITYEISYRNYNDKAATVTIRDKLDQNVSFVSADNGGKLSNGVVTWTLANVRAGRSGKVTLTVKVLEGALASRSGPGKVVNGGETATVQVGDDPAVTLETVENPLPEPHKKETEPYDGTGVLGGVKVGDEITYEISYRNYKGGMSDVVIRDKLDPNVLFVSASNGGKHSNGVVTWTLPKVAAGTSGKVILTVKVLEGALASKKGPGKVVNGGGTATVKVGNDQEFTLETVENPVEAEKPTATPTAKPTATPTLTPKPTATPTPKPTTKPSTKPTATPTAKPTTKPGGGGGGGTKPTATPTATPEPETVSVTIKKVWDDENNIAGTRPASIRVTLSNGTSYTLNAGNKWTVIVNDLPALDEDGEEILYTWTEQRVKGYRQSTVVNGNETTITNTFRLPPSLAPGGGGSLKVLEDYETPLGLNAIINHVGDCFE